MVLLRWLSGQKHLPCNPDDMSLIPRTHGGRDPTLETCHLIFICVSWHAHILIHIRCTHEGGSIRRRWRRKTDWKRMLSPWHLWCSHHQFGSKRVPACSELFWPGHFAVCGLKEIGWCGHQQSCGQEGCWGWHGHRVCTENSESLRNMIPNSSHSVTEEWSQSCLSQLVTYI